MEKKALIPLFVLFLVFSSAAVPISRSLKSFKDEPAIQDLHAQGEVSTRTKGELLDGKEVFTEGRMDFEDGDYPGTGTGIGTGTGTNDHHYYPGKGANYHYDYPRTGANYRNDPNPPPGTTV